MVKTCCIEGCQPETGRELTYFKFPKKQVYKQKWLKAIKAGRNIRRNSLVCSSHFLDTDYKLVQGKKTLKATVVPSVFGKLHKNHNTQSDLPVRRTRSSKLPLSDADDENSASDDDGYDRESSPGGDKSPVRTEQIDVNEAIVDNGQDKIDDVADNLSDSTKECGKTIDELMACLNGDVQEKTPNETESQETPSILVPDTSKSIVANDASQSPLDISMNPPIVSSAIENLDYEDLIAQSQVKTNELRRVYIDAINENKQSEGWYDGSVTKDLLEPEPVFISIPVDPVLASTYSPDTSPCADSIPEPVEVQVEVDPALLRYSGTGDDDDDDDNDADDDDDDDVQVIERPNEQVSLLTSSDDDDVIIEEPKIDTVEVSDETDEDDLPLTRYLKTKRGLDEFEKNFKDLLWGTAKEYYCYSCSYVSQSKSDLRTHTESHAKTSQIMVCPVCDFQSPSKAQFARHKRKHKEERRYKCHLCEYRARHKMSLVYHMKSHNDTDKVVYHKCKLCTYKSTDRLQMHMHLQNTHQVKIYMCDTCNYSTKRMGDLNRHTKVRHSLPMQEE